jgi:hypothetical protein
VPPYDHPTAFHDVLRQYPSTSPVALTPRLGRKIARGGERKTSAKLERGDRRRETEREREEGKGTRKRKTIPRGKV